jgi:hypothetical protein
VEASHLLGSANFAQLGNVECDEKVTQSEMK